MRTLRGKDPSARGPFLARQRLASSCNADAATGKGCSVAGRLSRATELHACASPGHCHADPRLGSNCHLTVISEKAAAFSEIK